MTRDKLSQSTSDAIGLMDDSPRENDLDNDG